MALHTGEDTVGHTAGKVKMEDLLRGAAWSVEVRAGTGEGGWLAGGGRRGAGPWLVGARCHTPGLVSICWVSVRSLVHNRRDGRLIGWRGRPSNDGVQWDAVTGDYVNISGRGLGRVPPGTEALRYTGKNNVVSLIRRMDLDLHLE